MLPPTMLIMINFEETPWLAKSASVKFDPHQRPRHGILQTDVGLTGRLD